MFDVVDVFNIVNVFNMVDVFDVVQHVNLNTPNILKLLNENPFHEFTSTDVASEFMKVFLSNVLAVVHLDTASLTTKTLSTL